MSAPVARRTLLCHPQTPCAADIEVTAEIGLDAAGTLVVAYRIVGDLARLRIPTEPLDAEYLWKHTCFEMFVGPIAGDAYVEHNFSPNGQVARFEFAAFRQRVPAPPAGADVSASSTCEPSALTLDARATLPPDLGSPLSISLTAIVEDDAGGLSYWALRHPSGRPEFHDRAGRALSLTLGAVPAIVDAPGPP
jgi:hypothetical protein